MTDMDMRPSAVLTRALERLGPNGEGWMQLSPVRNQCGGWMGWDGGMTCAYIAVGTNPSRADAYLKAAIGAASTDDVYNWNDAPERTFDDVRRAFAVAIGMAHADEEAAVAREAVTA